MFSKILIKLVDQAIVPAILLLLARVLSVIVVSRVFLIPFEIENSGFVFQSAQDYIVVNSYSLLTLLGFLTVGILYILLKSFIFHDTHVTPSLTTKLFALRLSSLIQNSFDVYSQGLVWVSYLYLLLLVSGLMALFGLIFTWVFYAALIFTIITTILFAFDVEREVEIKEGVFDDSTEVDEEYVLTIGGNSA